MSLEKKEVMPIRNVRWPGIKNRKERRKDLKKKLILTSLLVLALVATLVLSGCAGETGLKGDQGKQGIRGIQGEQGEQGEQGTQGIQGEQGLQGETGLQGVTGKAGAEGATGSTGAKGDEGEQGPRGYTGAGARGATGATGPTSLFTVSLVSWKGGTATLTNTQALLGSWSIDLSTTTNIAAPDEGTIVITPTVPLALGYLQSVSWKEYLVIGYPPHIDIYLDNNGDGIADDSLVVEYAYNAMPHYAENGGLMPYGALLGAWYATFSDDGSGPAQVKDTCYAWLNSGAPGPPIPAGGTALNHTGGTLSQWKAGTLGTFDATSTIVKIELEVDNWVVQSQAYVDQITINGIVIWAQ